MKTPQLASLTLALTIGSRLVCASPIFVNEIHYDNAGADLGEAIEIAGPAGSDLGGWRLVLYNGNSSAAYYTQVLSGVIGDQQDGFGALAFSFAGGLQNGSADGLALVDAAADVIQFLSYEGTITAVSGVAAGLTSVDIGVAETSSTLAGTSLQLLGAGSLYGDFSWSGSASASFGALNSGQTFQRVTPLASASTRAAVPVPSTSLLFCLGLLSLVCVWRGGRPADRRVSQIAGLNSRPG